MSPQIYLLCLTGSVPMKYKFQEYQIPINIVLPENFPEKGPKVFLGFVVDEDSAKNNPLIKNGNEVLNNYIFKWEESQQYNLGGLCWNLSKSFDIYPPLGKAGAGLLNTDVIYIANDPSRPLPSNVVKKEYTVEKEPPKVPEHLNTHNPREMPMDEDAQIKMIEREERKDLIKKVSKKLQNKLQALNSSIDGLDDSIQGDDQISKAKAYLEDNSNKLKKQTLMLESEKAEMEEGIKQMREFIAKNKGRDVNEVGLNNH